MTDTTAIDTLLSQARRIVVTEGKASISLVQRSLRIGYNRAARMLESLEQAGVVSAMDGEGSRAILISVADLPALEDAEPADPSTQATEVGEGWTDIPADADETGDKAADGSAWGTTDHASAFLMGRLLDISKRRFTTLAEPWSRLRETEQAAVLKRLNEDIRGAVKDAVKIIAANGRVTFRAEVESVQFKGPSDVKAALKLSNSPETHSLADVAGGYVTIVIESLDELLDVPESALAGEPDNKPLFDDTPTGAFGTEPEVAAEAG